MKCIDDLIFNSGTSFSFTYPPNTCTGPEHIFVLRFCLEERTFSAVEPYFVAFCSKPERCEEWNEKTFLYVLEVFVQVFKFVAP